MFFKVIIAGKSYELERLTLGDTVLLKKRFGLTDLEQFSPSDPEAMLGLLALTISKQDGISIADATLAAEDIDLADFEPVAEEEAEGESQAAGGAAAVVPAKSGNRAKPRKKPGVQS